MKEIVRKIYEEEDKVLARVVYDLTNPMDAYEGKAEEYINNTNLTSATEKEIFEKLDKFNLKVLSKEERAKIFQELHNRQVQENGFKPRYVVEMKPIEDTLLGYMEPSTNELVLNQTALNRLCNSKGSDVITKNPGLRFSLILMHETCHVIQMEKAVKLIKNEKMSKEDTLRASLTLMKLVVEYYAEINKDYGLISAINDTYWYDNDEFQANMEPINIVLDKMSKKVLDGKSSVGVLKYWIRESLDVTDGDMKSYFNRYLNRMENISLRFVDIFEKEIKDGPLKEKLLKNIKAGFEKDENGNNTYREMQSKYFEKCLDLMNAKDRIDLVEKC